MVAVSFLQTSNYFRYVNKLKIALLLLLASCSAPTSDNYDPSKYYNDEERADLLSGIVTYVFSAPPYTAMKDRFKPEHKIFYDTVSTRLFSLDRLYVDDNGRHFYLIVRPGSHTKQKRAAGGFFDLADDKSFKNFRETFVTPQGPDSAAQAKGRFLFDQMVKGDLQRFLKMESYAQWPNPISYYDSVTYEWKMDVSLNKGDTLKVIDTLKIN